MKEQGSFRQQAKFSRRILRSPMPNKHPDTGEEWTFGFNLNLMKEKNWVEV